MILTAENYHSPEAYKNYMSASRYKDFAGCLGIAGCEARAMAMFRGQWKEDPTPAMKVSSYVDAHFSGSLDVFKAINPDIFTKSTGNLLAPYMKINHTIQVIEADEYLMKCLSGQKQVIMTADWLGTKWSIMIDSYHPDKLIVDLKVMAELKKAHYAKDHGKMSFVEYYGYWEQAAIYTKVCEAATGKRLPFLLACASKEEYPDKEVIGFTDQDIDNAVTVIESRMPRILDLRSGTVSPDRCESCDYCRFTKKITGPIHYSQLI